MIKKTGFKILFLFFSCIFAFNMGLTDCNALVTGNNPYVKVQGRQLVVDFTGNGNYQPFVIQGAGYEPIPIGRYSSDWGYDATQSPTNPSTEQNPNNLPENIYADTTILDRDFSLLQQMHANTIRIWKGDNTLEVSGQSSQGGANISATTFANAFPLPPDGYTPSTYGAYIYSWLQNNNYVSLTGTITVNLASPTAASSFLSALQAEFTQPSQYDTILDVMQLAQNGDALPGRFPNMITPVTLATAGQYNLHVIAGFYVAPFGPTNCSTTSCLYTYNPDSNDPGLNAPFDLTNPYIRNDILMRFEEYVNTFKNDPNILFWAIGNENNLSLNPNYTAQVQAWYSLVNQMAGAAHQIEGANYHPVAVVEGGDLLYIGNPAYGADDNSLPNVDIWGTNIYLGQSFGNYFLQYKSLSSKPLWISEYGIDAFQSCNTTDPSVCDPNNPSGTEDQADQATWDGDLWNEIAGNGDIAIGATVMEYSDEWWKPYDWLCSQIFPYDTPPYVPPGLTPGQEADYCHWNHFNFGEGPGSSWGNLTAPEPDYYFNEEWWGLMGISNTAPQTQADTMTPRQVYYTLQGEFAGNTALPSYLVSPVAGTTLNATSVSFAWSLGRGVSQYELLVGTTPGSDNIYSNSGLTVTTATVAGIPLTGQPVYVQLGSYINGAWQVSNYNFATINNAITASAGTGGAISPSGIVSVNYGANQIFTITPETGYIINQVLVDGVPVTLTNDTYTFTDVTGAHTIAVSFEQALPVVSIISPVDNASYTVLRRWATHITITAVATDNNGIIRSVSFYNGPILLGTVTRSPYTFTWRRVFPGNYSLTAVARDSNGEVGVSSAVNITVTGLPEVNLEADKFVSAAPATVTLTAAASEANGSISKVDFYNGGTLLGSATSSPYVFIWSNIPAGRYFLTAVAYDKNNHMRRSTTVVVMVYDWPSVNTRFTSFTDSRHHSLW